MNEAVSFGAPDEKYGEVVAAAVVLSKPVDDEAAVIADIRKLAATKLAKFKVCDLTNIPAMHVEAACAQEYSHFSYFKRFYILETCWEPPEAPIFNKKINTSVISEMLRTIIISNYAD